jgi:hypothetical protein
VYEHFLVCALENYYGVRQQEAIEVVRKLKIFHPFGAVGELDWGMPGQSTVDFGGDDLRNVSHLLKLAEQIKTFYERVHDDTMVTEMQAEVENAEVIVFLGFAFHRPNMEIIRPKSISVERVFATVRGMSNPDRDMVECYLTEEFGCGDIPIELCDMMCKEFFTDYSRSLTG